MRKLVVCFVLSLVLLSSAAYASIFSQLHGVVHDPQHRPIAGAQIELRAVHSAFSRTAITAQDGSFTMSSIPLGDYGIAVSQTGFATAKETFSLASDTAPVLHFELQLSTVEQTTSVTTNNNDADVNTVTPSTLISREDIARTPGADRTNSMAMITDYVPGAYMTHDMLHMRGGHQVSWLIDGVQIPNTSIASNLGAQIDPKDIDFIEVQRGSYTADTGDRTYGAFNVVPRSGFERNRQAELVLSAGSFLQTNDQLNFGDHTQKFAYYASLNGNCSDFGLSPPVGKVLHDATNGYGGFASLIYNLRPKDQLRLVTQLRNDFFQIPYDPGPNSFENQQYDSSGLRDGQHETDGIAAFSWLHSYSSNTVLQVSPFFHYNKANYESDPNDTPVATTSNRSSNYAGVQASIDTEIARNTLQAGFYSLWPARQLRLRRHLQRRQREPVLPYAGVHLGRGNRRVRLGQLQSDLLAHSDWRPAPDPLPGLVLGECVGSALRHRHSRSQAEVGVPRVLRPLLPASTPAYGLRADRPVCAEQDHQLCLSAGRTG